MRPAAARGGRFSSGARSLRRSIPERDWNRLFSPWLLAWPANLIILDAPAQVDSDVVSSVSVSIFQHLCLCLTGLHNERHALLEMIGKPA